MKSSTSMVEAVVRRPVPENLHVKTEIRSDALNPYVIPQSPARSSSLLPPPSPSRPKVDPQYSARLQQYSVSGLTSTGTPSPSRKRRSNHNANNNYFFGSTVGGQMFFSTPERKGVGTKDNQRSSSSPNGENSGGIHSPSAMFSPTSSAPGTPSSRLASMDDNAENLVVDVEYSDRFIPSRATSNLSFSVLDTEDRSVGVDSTSDGGHPSTPGGSDASSPGNSHRRTNSHEGSGSQSILNLLLRSELIDENTYVARANFTPTLSSPPSHETTNFFRFRNSRQYYQDEVLSDLTGGGVIKSVVKPFNISPIGSASSHLLMATPEKPCRKIAKVPFKVLDAPALQDDFYLNLVDW
jgi:hypothetical protein